MKLRLFSCYAECHHTPAIGDGGQHHERDPQRKDKVNAKRGRDQIEQEFASSDDNEEEENTMEVDSTTYVVVVGPETGSRRATSFPLNFAGNAVTIKAGTQPSRRDESIAVHPYSDRLWAL